MRSNRAAHPEPLKRRAVSFRSSRRPGGRRTLGVLVMRRATLKALTPLWAVALVVSLVHVLASHNRPQPGEITLLDITLLTFSAVILPFIAGLLYTRRCNGTVRKAFLVGATIPIADIVGVGMAYAVLQAGWLALAGLLLATVMYTLAPAAIFGAAGGWTGRRYGPTHT